MWIWQRNKNPHYHRLVHPWHKPTAGDPVDLDARFGLLAGIAFNCCIIQGISSGFYSIDLYFRCAGFLLGLIPIASSIYAAWFTARDTAKPLFELITLTTLHDRQIVWGYIHALINRFRVVLGFQFGILITFAIATIFFILTTSLFYEFPDQQEVEQAQFTLRFLLIGMLLSSGYILIYWLVNLMGILNGLWWRQAERVLIPTFSVSILLIGLWSASAIAIVKHLYDARYGLVLAGAAGIQVLMPGIGVYVTLKLSYYTVRSGCSR